MAIRVGWLKGVPLRWAKASLPAFSLVLKLGKRHTAASLFAGWCSLHLGQGLRRRIRSFRKTIHI